MNSELHFVKWHKYKLYADILASHLWRRMVDFRAANTCVNHFFHRYNCCNYSNRVRSLQYTLHHGIDTVNHNFDGIESNRIRLDFIELNLFLSNLVFNLQFKIYNSQFKWMDG